MLREENAMGIWLIRGFAMVCVLLALAACEDKQEDYKTLFSDDFNRSNGALGSDWVTDIPAGSSMQISGQVVESDGTNGTPAAFYPDPISKKYDQRVSVDAIISGGTYDSANSLFGIIIRATEPSKNAVNDWLYLGFGTQVVLQVDAGGRALGVELSVSLGGGFALRLHHGWRGAAGALAAALDLGVG